MFLSVGLIFIAGSSVHCSGLFFGVRLGAPSSDFLRARSPRLQLREGPASEVGLTVVPMATALEVETAAVAEMVAAVEAIKLMRSNTSIQNGRERRAVDFKRWALEH